MPDARQQMIDAAVRMYGDDLEKIAGARRWLEELTEGADERKLTAAAEKFERADHALRPFTVRKVFLIAAAVVAVALNAWFVWVDHTDKGPFNPSSASLSKSSLLTGLSPSERLLIGNSGEPRLLRSRKLWESDPSNPAYFAEYAVTFHKENKALPPGFSETAKSLDPGNAWFDYLAAAVIGSGSVKKPKRTEEEKAAGKVHPWQIVDDAKFQEALGHIARTRGKTRFDSYEGEMIRKRILLLPQKSPQERTASIHYLMVSQTSYLNLLKLAAIYGARASELERTGDLEEFRRLLDDVHACAHRLSEDAAFNLVQELSVRAFISSTTMELERRAEKLGVLEEAPWIQEWKTGLERYKEAKTAENHKGKRLSKVVKRQGSYFAAMTLPVVLKQAVNPPLLTPGDLKPGRLEEYTYLSRGCGALLAIWFALVAVTLFFYRFRASAIVRLMARRAEQLLSPVDWIWIIGIGVLFPSVLVLAGMVFTPLGGWERSVFGHVNSEMGMVQTVSNFAGLGLLVIVVSMLVIRWRLRLAASVFGFQARLASGCVAVLLLCVATWGGGHIKPHWLTASIAAFPVIWLLFITTRAVFSRPELLLERVVISRMMLPACAAAVLLMLAASFGFHAARLHWFRKDELMKLSADEPGLGPYEYRVTRQMRGELRELLDKHR
jgi:hypothetical protein